MNRTKMTSSKVGSFGSPSISSSLMTRIAMNQNNASPGSKKLRTELRRVMSDRVLKITRCSQKQNVDKIKQKTELNNSKIVNGDNCENTSINHIEHSSSTPNFALSQKNQTNTNLKNETNSDINSENTIESISFPDFKDKNELLDFVKKSYEQLVEKNVNLGKTVAEISNAIKYFSKTSNLDSQNLISEILKENLIQTPFQLKQRYKGNEISENLKTESQIQVLLSLEEYISVNSSSNKIPVDEDFVWEVANSVRWISQTFKEKFKIEKFLFGEIYPSYFAKAPELILNLMEELGYDKEENLDESFNSSNAASASNSLLMSPNKSPSRLLKNDNNYSQFSESFSKDENVNSTPGISKLNALFEDFCPKNEQESNENDEFIASQKNEEKDNDSDDLLNDFKKKKAINRFSSFNGNSTTGRSIVIQSKKRMRLKIRSPCKDSSVSTKNKASNEGVKKSPESKASNILIEDDNGKKRPRTYLITDTPDHKQKTTIIRTKQEKIRKRFSFQPLNTNSNSNNSSLPVIPDTPVKNDNRFINSTEPIPPIGIISSRGAEFFKNKIFSSPSKILSPKKS